MSDYLTQGPKVEEFEGKFADYVGVNYAVSVNNATSGLHLSVLALDIKRVIELLQHQLLLHPQQTVFAFQVVKYGLLILIQILIYWI